MISSCDRDVLDRLQSIDGQGGVTTREVDCAEIGWGPISDFRSVTAEDD
jgi:hypothetical protein